MTEEAKRVAVELYLITLGEFIKAGEPLTGSVISASAKLAKDAAILFDRIVFETDE